MLDKVEKWGDSVDAAVELALKELKISREEADVEVLEQPSKGFLGFHKKLAKVRVTRKPEPEKKPEPEISSDTEPAETRSADRNRASSGSAGSEEDSSRSRRESGSTFFGENTYVMSDPLNNADEDSGDTAETDEAVPSQEDKKPQRKERRGRRTGGSSEVMHTKFTVTDADKSAVPADDSYAADFIREIVKQMNLSVEVKASIIDDILYVSLTGDEVGALIGKRGKTLDSLQYLASIVQNKNSDKYTRVLVNAEHYREKREKTLQQLARKVADKCARTGKSQRLEPMSPYERKVIHSTLQGDPRVTTRSEGTEPSRRVVIELKK